MWCATSWRAHCPIRTVQAVLGPVVEELVARFRPRTTAAYWELFINGDRAAAAKPGASTRHGNS